MERLIQSILAAPATIVHPEVICHAHTPVLRVFQRTIVLHCHPNLPPTLPDSIRAALLTGPGHEGRSQRLAQPGLPQSTPRGLLAAGPYPYTYTHTYTHCVLLTGPGHRRRARLLAQPGLPQPTPAWLVAAKPAAARHPAHRVDCRFGRAQGRMAVRPVQPAVLFNGSDADHGAPQRLAAGQDHGHD
eukprot:1161047-Pelagomonas_calceolata.AAC.64